MGIDLKALHIHFMFPHEFLKEIKSHYVSLLLKFDFKIIANMIFR